MKNMKYDLEVWEDNGGGVYLVILEDDVPQKIFMNWEYQDKGTLQSAMDLIAENPDDWMGWDGDHVDWLNDVNHYSEDDPDRYTTQGVYDDFLESWENDNGMVPVVVNGRYYTDRMGDDALDALGIEEEGE